MGQINQNRICLLFTGTVIPNSNFVAHADPVVRLKEYSDNLAFYASLLPGTPIYFLENSAYDFSANAEFQKLLAGKNITLLKFPVSDKFSQGKGYQEFEMLDKAIESLRTKYDAFVKVTGRYRVHNLRGLLTSIRSNFVADSHRKPQVTLTNVFYTTAEFYLANLKGLYTQVDDSKGIFIEKLVYQQLQRKKLFSETNMFRVNPVITGTSGSYGGTLNRNKIKMKIRNLERTLLRLAGIREFLAEY
jgi:hypothetical protein